VPQLYVSGTNLSNMTLDPTQMSILVQSLETGQSYGVTSYIASVWSPPASMKTNDSLPGGSLRTDAESTYALGRADASDLPEAASARRALLLERVKEHMSAAPAAEQKKAPAELRERVLLDPAVEDRNEGIRLEGARRFRGDEDLQLQLLRVHAFLGYGDVVEPIETAVPRIAAPRRT